MIRQPKYARHMQRFGKHIRTAVGMSGGLTMRIALSIPENIPYFVSPKHSIDPLMTYVH